MKMDKASFGYLHNYEFLLRDLFDLSKDNIQIKEHKVLGILLQGVTEVIYALIKLFSFGNNLGQSLLCEL